MHANPQRLDPIAEVVADIGVEGVGSVVAAALRLRVDRDGDQGVNGGGIGRGREGDVVADSGQSGGGRQGS